MHGIFGVDPGVQREEKRQRSEEPDQDTALEAGHGWVRKQRGYKFFWGRISFE